MCLDSSYCSVYSSGVEESILQKSNCLIEQKIQTWDAHYKCTECEKVFFEIIFIIDFKHKVEGFYSYKEEVESLLQN